MRIEYLSEGNGFEREIAGGSCHAGVVSTLQLVMAGHPGYTLGKEFLRRAYHGQ